MEEKVWKWKQLQYKLLCVNLIQKSLDGPKGYFLKVEQQILEFCEFKIVEIKTQLHGK